MLDFINEKLLQLDIQRIADVTGLDTLGIPTISIVRPSSLSISTSLGKGLNTEQAVISAFMECCELWAAERSIPDVVDNNVIAASADLYVSNCRTFFSNLVEPAISRLLDKRIPMDWNIAENIYSGEHFAVPHDCVHMRPIHQENAYLRTIQSTNGLGAGGTIDEATVHAICEVIERDAVTLFRQYPVTKQMENLVSISSCSTEINNIAAEVSSNGLTLLLFDITSDINVPVFLCAIADTAPSAPTHMRLVFGASCNLNSDAAAIGAITEAAQARIAFIMASREDFNPQWVTNFTSPTTCSASVKEAKLFFTTSTDQGKPIRQESDTPACPKDSLRCIMATLAKHGAKHSDNSVQILRVRLTRDEFFPSVVKVFILGLEHPIDTVDYDPGPRALRNTVGPWM